MLIKTLTLAFMALPQAFGLALNMPRAQSPGTDPFYIPPKGFDETAPGTILRQRIVPVSFFGFIPNPVEAYQLLYRTTAIDGSAIATVTTVFKPLIRKTDRFISFHTAYDSSAAVCDPSYTYQLGSPPTTDLISSAEMLILELYLLQGYIVASPDYEGPDAAFGPGHLEGMSVLDGMRAVQNFKTTLGLSTNTPRIVGIGYSGGSIATGWAASLHQTYAPELLVKGWVQGGTPANLTGTAVNIDGTLFSGFLPAALDGLNKPSSYSTQLSPVIDSIITPSGTAVLQYAASNCAIGDLLNFAEKSFQSTEYQSLGSNLFYHPTIATVLEQNTMGVYTNQTPVAPVFMYHASQDEIIPFSNASTLASAWCNNGADVSFTTVGNGGHITTEIIGIPGVVDFVSAAFAGTVPSGCSRTTELDSSLNPLALGVEFEPILVALVEILASAGKGDANILKSLGAFR